MRLAVIADLHGNLPALEAAVADFMPWAPDHVVLAGDLINAAPFSVEVVEYVMDQDWLVIRGNHEFYFLDFGSRRMHSEVQCQDRWQALHALHAGIPDHVGRYLATLPDDLTLMYPQCEPLRVLHGLPGDPRAGLYPHQLDSKIMGLLRLVSQHTLITAHTHLQGEFWIPRGEEAPSPRSPNPPFKSDELRAAHWHAVNPGSIGISLNGCPEAHYALMESVADAPEGEGWQTTLQHVAYDRERTLRAFFERGHLDAGGPILELFYWEIVSAQPEIISFMAWSRRHGFDPHAELQTALHTYKRKTGRAQVIADMDPSGCYARYIA